MSAADRGWGPGWPNCQYDKIVTIVRDDGLRLPVREELAPLITKLIDRTENVGYDVRPGETWGFACRAIRGSTKPSNHSWGLAVDINAPANPMASADWHRRNANEQTSTFPFGLEIVTDMSEIMAAIWEDNMFRWGGRYPNRPDPMHFEFMGTPEDTARLAANLDPGGPMASQLDRIERHLQGRDPGDGTEPHRKFVHDQHKHTRSDIETQAERTRIGTVKALAISNAQLKADLVTEIDVKIEELKKYIAELAGE